MIRLPYFLKKPEGIRIPIIGKAWIKVAISLEYFYINNVKIKSYVLNNIRRNRKVIVSLTSIPERIYYATLAIKSLMIQSYKPDLIILWLSEMQFKGKVIPREIIELQKYGLQIRYCEDLRSHKKYFYAMKEFSNDIIITFDDDIIYEVSAIEKLIKYYYIYPNCIICNRGFEITFSNSMVQSSKKWKLLSREGVKKPSLKILASTGAGCLYPPKSLSTEVFNLDVINSVAKTTDDIWMKFMSLLNNTKIVKTSMYSRQLVIIPGSQKIQLSYTNSVNGQNDAVFKKLCKIYPNALGTLQKTYEEFFR